MIKCKKIPELKIEEIETKEVEALENFKKEADKAIKTINENHFHLRLWRAVRGDDDVS